MSDRCSDCGSSVAEVELGYPVVRQCPLHIEGCAHEEAATKVFCRGACRWELVIWDCACYPCRVGEGDCAVLKRHAGG